MICTSLMNFIWGWISHDGVMTLLCEAKLWYAYCLWTYIVNLLCRNITGATLKGFLAPELGLLTYLQELYASKLKKKLTQFMFPCLLVVWLLLTFSMLIICRILNNNNLLGIIPKELGMLKNLEVLDLGKNQLSGPIPHELGNLTNIKKM